MGSGSSDDGISDEEKNMLKLQQSMKSETWDATKNYSNSPYSKFRGDRFEGFDSQEQQAQDRMLQFAGNRAGYYDEAMNSARPNLGFGGEFQRQNLDPVSQQELERGVATRMNPYEQQVIDRSMGDFNRARQMTMMDNAGDAVAGSAFGGSRQGVQNALTNEGFAREAGNTAAQLRYAGYNDALGGYEGERARLQGLGLQQEGMSADDAARAVGLRNSTSSLYASLGDLKDRDQLDRIGLQEAVGTKRRAMGQQDKDFAYIEHENQRIDQANKIGMMQAMANGTQFTPTPRLSSNKNAGMAGGAIAGAGTGAKVGHSIYGPTGAAYGAVAGGILGAWGGSQ